MLKIPEKYKRCGIKVKCLKCKWQIKNKCGDTGKSVVSCKHQDKHRLNLILCIPGTKGGRKSRILETRNFDDALRELSTFREECKKQGYHKTTVPPKGIHTTNLKELAASYLDAISGVNTPAVLIRLRSKEHIEDSTRVIQRFSNALKKRGYNTQSLCITKICDEETSIFHEYLLNDLQLGDFAYKRHMAVMKTFFNWVIRVKDKQILNPFNHIELHSIHRDITIISKEEFQKLLEVTTRENGFEKVRNRNLYHSWLPVAYRLALETGLRREELVILKFSDLIALDNQKLVFRIDNLKVNRIRTGNSRGNYIKYVPVTQSLMLLLKELGYERKKDSDEYIIERPDGMDTKYMMDLLSRSFSHFITLVTDRKIEFKDLRKTYITHLTSTLGSNAKLFTGHASDQVLKNHYLSSAFLAGNLTDFSVFR